MKLTCLQKNTIQNHCSELKLNTYEFDPAEISFNHLNFDTNDNQPIKKFIGMKRFSYALLFIFLSLALNSNAQKETELVKKDTLWAKGGSYSLNFTQVSLTNWAAGGQNAVSGVSYLKLFANYNKSKLSWENLLDVGYGLSQQKGIPTQKNEDRFEIQSKLGIKSSGKLYYTFFLNAKTQFSPGYADAQNTKEISSFLAPGYINFSMGIDYKPSKVFSLYFSPVSGKMTIVTNDSLSAVGAYGVEKGEKLRYEFGAQVNSKLAVNIAKNVSFTSTLNLFTNYLKNPQNIDVNWISGIDMKINKYLTATIVTNLLYDDDIKTPVKNKEGVTASQIQFKELLGVGLSIKF